MEGVRGGEDIDLFLTKRKIPRDPFEAQMLETLGKIYGDAPPRKRRRKR